MQIGRESIQNLVVGMVLEFSFLKRHEFEKTPSHASSLGNKFKKITLNFIL